MDTTENIAELTAREVISFAEASTIMRAVENLKERIQKANFFASQDFMDEIGDEMLDYLEEFSMILLEHNEPIFNKFGEAL